MSESRRHHLVPRFILKRFAKDGSLDLLERKDLTRVIRSSVSNALLMKDFYTLETDEGDDRAVETFFANEVEAPAANAIRRLVDDRRSVLAPGIRHPICWFLAFQRLRGRAVREMLVEHYEASTRLEMSLTPAAAFKKTAREHGEDITDEEAEDLAAFARSGAYKLVVHREANLHLGSVMKAAPEMAKWLDRRSWRLLEFAGPVLATCDEPVVFVGEDPGVPGEALGVANAREIVFPIDPRHALVLVRHDIGAEEGRFPAGETQAEIINRHVAFGAHKYIVRHPGTDPLRDAVVPQKAPSVVVDGNVIGMQQNANTRRRAESLAKVRKKLGSRE